MKTKQGYILYFDILGYKSLLHNNSEQENKKVADILERIVNLYSKFDSNIEYAKGFDKNKLFKRFFSDNFLFLYEIEQDDYNGLKIIQEVASKIQYQFLCSGLLTRGSITYGEISYTDDIVFGLDLVRAVELEDSHRMPSMAVDEKLKDVFMKNNIEFKEEITLFDILSKEQIDYTQCVEGIKIYLENLNKKYVDNKIIDKIKWFLTQLNIYFGNNQQINLNLICEYKYSIQQNNGNIEQ